MNSVLEQLISDVVQVCGTEKPIWLDPDAPVFNNNISNESLYLIGVIGGKDVGKSSLINALIGQKIAGVSCVGEGTSRAMAYVHDDDQHNARRLLDDLIPDQFEIQTHRNPDGLGRLLLDLPDIDSIWSSHVELSRKLLKRMLYPIWVQSVEKYADREPLQLLSQVAKGNAPENFLFVLTKCDQLAHRHGQGAIQELADDYASRVARACGMEGAAQIFNVNTQNPGSMDLPELHDRVMSRRSRGEVSRSIELAGNRREAAMVDWLRSQGVDRKLQTLQRLEEMTCQRIADRITIPLVEQLSTRLASDSTLRSRIIEPIIRSRLSYWPIINVIDATLGPVVAAFSSAGGKPLAASIAERSLARHIQGVFSELSQQDARFFDLYQHQKLWEQDTAVSTANRIEQKLDLAIDLQQDLLRKTSARPSLITRIFAPVVTIGAALWFPIVQPIMEIVLQQTTFQMTRELVLMIIQLLGATYLIRSVGFLAIYFIAIWMWLRWFTANRVMHTLSHTTADNHPADEIFRWADELAQPVKREVEKMEQLNIRIQSISDPGRSAA